MSWLGAVLIGVVAAISGLVLNLDRPFLTNQSHISQAMAAETSQMNAAAESAPLAKQRVDLIQQPIAIKSTQRESPRLLTLKGISKGNYRSVANLIKRAPWHSSRHVR